MIGTENYKIST